MFFFPIISIYFCCWCTNINALFINETPTVAHASGCAKYKILSQWPIYTPNAMLDLSAITGPFLQWHPDVFARRESGPSLLLLMWMHSIMLLSAVCFWMAGSALGSWVCWGIFCSFAPHDKDDKTHHCISELQRWFIAQGLQLWGPQRQGVDETHASIVHIRVSPTAAAWW